MNRLDVPRVSLAQETKLPPVVKGWPLVGVIPQVMNQQLDFLHQSFLKYGDIFSLDLGVIDVVCLNHPDYAQHVLVDNFRNYRKGGAFWDRIRNVLGNGLSVSEGEEWRRQRRMIQPHFHKQRIQNLTEAMIKATDESLTHWENVSPTQSFDIANAMTHTTMRIIVKTMFGTSMTEEMANEVGQTVGYITNFVLRALVTDALPPWLPVPGREAYAQAIRRTEELMYQVIEQRRQENKPGDDFLSMLLEMVDSESGDKLNDNELRDQAMTMFVAGFETTSVALSWTLHFLASCPEIQERAYQEVNRVIGKEPPTFDKLIQLTYIRQIFQEALRYYSAAYWIPRTAIEDDVIDGYQIKAGQIVGVVVHNIHHNPKYWPNPSEFNPERFTTEKVKEHHHLAWLPFGAGQRQCIGREFSFMEGAAVLTRILQKYKLVAVPNHIPKPKLGGGLRVKNGVMVYLQPR